MSAPFSCPSAFPVLTLPDHSRPAILCPRMAKRFVQGTTLRLRSGQAFSRADPAFPLSYPERALACEARALSRDPSDSKWSSFRHYAFREMNVVENESEWTRRDRELKLTGGRPACSSAQVGPGAPLIPSFGMSGFRESQTLRTSYQACAPPAHSSENRG